MTDLIFGHRRPRFAYSRARKRQTPNTIKRWLVGVIFVLVVSPLLTTVYSITRAGESARVYAATSSNLNFQGRLLNSSGSLVNDGSYSIEFKLYDAVTGGTNEWTGSYSVSVKNGYFSVQLGSGATPFAGSIDWSQEKWLTMNVNSDGEMTPRIKLTATPYSFRSGLADALSITGGSITGDNLLQKAPSSIQSVSSANAGLRFNQTGAGGLIQLQGNGLDVFTVSKVGNAALAGDVDIGGTLAVGTGNALQVDSSGNLSTTGTVTTGTVTNAGILNLTATGAGNDIVMNGADRVDITAGTTIELLSNTNLTGNLDISGTLNIGTNNALKVDANGSLTTTFQALNGTSTANGGSGLGTSTSLTLASAANFDIGNYVQVNSNNCGGAGSGINVCYAKITNKAGNQLTITPALAWANGATVNEYYIPEVGGTNTGSTLANRFGRGYFIAGVATGNGTTFYNEDSIDTNLTSFDLLNTNATTINFGGAATTLNIGNSGTTVNLLGSLQTSASETITAGGGLIVSAGGISNNSGGITGAGSITGITGLTFTSGNLNLNNGGITNAGSLAGVTSISASGSITAATSGTINGLSINSGNLSGLTGMTFTSGGLNLNAGGITNAGAISGVAGLTFTSGNLALGGGNITGASSISASTAVNTPSVTNAGILTLSATGAGNDVILNAADQIQLNAGSTIELQDNTNITGALNLTGGITNTTSVKFATSGGNPAYAEGLLFYDNTQKALSYYNSESQVTLNLGQENYVYVYNNTGATITDGQVVYVNGVNAGVPSVTLARADVVTTAHAVGVATHSIETGTFGFVTSFGEINSLNTSAFTAGDTIYLSSTTAGALTNVRPTQPNFTTIIGKVTESNASTGKILVDLSGYQYGAYTPGAIAFGGSDGNVKQDATNFFWDDTNNRLGLGDATPVATLTVGSGDLFQVAGATGNVSTSGTLTIAGLATFNGNITLQTGDTLTVNGEAFTDLTGNGLILSGTTLSVDTATTGTTAVTGANSGLETTATGIRLLGGCSNNQILKWSTTGPQWNCAADATGISDARLKKNIESVDMDVLSRIRNVNLYSFDFDCTNPAFQRMHCDTDHQIGVIAQELIELFPELVIEVNGHYEVRYDALGLYNLKAVGELANKVDDITEHGVLGAVTTGNMLRLDANGVLQNITGLSMTGGASIAGGLSNNGDGIQNVGALSGVTSIGAQSISLSASQSANMLTLTKDGNNVFTVFNSGALELKLDSNNALAVKSANGDNALNVDTLTGKVKIGAGNNGKTVLFVLDTKSSDGDPPGVNGAQYYNSKLNKFRCYQKDKWQDCLQTSFSEYGLISQSQSWQQAASEGEPPGEHRTWVDLSNGNQIRLLANLTTAGPVGSSCKLQYALTDTNPDWKDLASSGQLGIDKTGALKSDWLQITDDAKAEVLIRVMCKGGNTTSIVEVNSVRIQVR